MVRKSSEHMVRKKAVNDFLIWRAGNSVGWDCTRSDIARETGLSVDTVCNTCKRRGWTMATGNAEYVQHAIDVVSMMKGMNQ